jgi:hypothetical protein
MKKKKKEKYKGTAGWYVLNQKTQKFGDRRTKRNRTRSEKTRREIDSYSMA